jgi:hypothetical protein
VEENCARVERQTSYFNPVESDMQREKSARKRAGKLLESRVIYTCRSLSRNKIWPWTLAI